MVRVNLEHSCEGCRTYRHPDTGIVDCHFEAYNENDICPCALCIVKTMCNQACDEFEEFRVDVLNLIAS